VTDVLLDYFLKVYTTQSFPQEMAQRTEAALGHLPAVARMAFALRDRKTLSPSAQRHVHQRTMFQKLQEVTEFFLSLTPDDYIAGQRLLERTLDYQQFCHDLDATFRAHGPVRSRTGFSSDARYRACAAILIHFELETGCLTTIAATFGRYVRASKSRPK
jgi:hypothetical protein